MYNRHGTRAGFFRRAGGASAPVPQRTGLFMRKTRIRRTPRKRFILASLFLLLAVGAALFFAVSPFRKTPDAEFAATEQAAAPASPEKEDVSGGTDPSSDGRDAEPKARGPLMYHGTVSSGDTAAVLLQEWLNQGEIQAVSDASRSVFALNRLRMGNPYTVTFTADEGFLSFSYEIDNEQKLIISKNGDGFNAHLERIPYTVLLERVTGSIDSSLFQAVADAGESPTLAIALADIFAWEINFIRDLRDGDKFTLIVEKRFREGTFAGYGKIRAASFTNQGETFEGFLFKDSLGTPHYFNIKGESVKRAFLKAPLSFTRISSQFTNRRFHPVLNVWRAHPAVDYAAPTGTPVKAVGGGIVSFSGWGNGAGNYVALRHPGGYETMYLHLSRIARTAKKGVKVSQGEIIGYVGSTGVSTGPHLDFRMKKDGSYVNPLKVLSPRSEPVSKKDQPAFARHAALWRGYLDGTRDLPLEP